MCFLDSLLVHENKAVDHGLKPRKSVPSLTPRGPGLPGSPELGSRKHASGEDGRTGESLQHSSAVVPSVYQVFQEASGGDGSSRRKPSRIGRLSRSLELGAWRVICVGARTVERGGGEPSQALYNEVNAFLQREHREFSSGPS